MFHKLIKEKRLKKNNHLITLIKTRSRNGMYAWIKKTIFVGINQIIPVIIFPGTSLETLETEADESSIS